MNGMRILVLRAKYDKRYELEERIDFISGVIMSDADVEEINQVEQLQCELNALNKEILSLEKLIGVNNIL